MRDPDVAEDLLAETFAGALRGLHRCHADGEAGAGGWLFGIARNLVRKRARRHAQSARMQGRLALIGVSDTTSSDDPSVEVGGAGQQLAAALASLPKGQRRAVLLRVAEEETYVSIAETLSCSVGAARIRVSRGLQALAPSTQSGPPADTVYRDQGGNPLALACIADGNALGCTAVGVGTGLPDADEVALYDLTGS